MFLITGCGRSGTKYTAAVLQSLGIDVGHEQPGKDGEVGWKGLYRLLSGQPHSYRKIIHQVRHPLDTISSLRTHTNYLLDSVAQFFPTRSVVTTTDGKLHRCMEYWYQWNKLAEHQASWTYRIEDFPSAFPALCEVLGLSGFPEKWPEIPDNLNTRRTKRFERFQQEPVTWEKLESIDSELTHRVRELATQYGYSDRRRHASRTKNGLVKLSRHSNKRSQNDRLRSGRPLKILIDPFLLDMAQVRSITRSICDGKQYLASSADPPVENSWTLSWGYPVTKRRFAVAETGFFGTQCI